MPPDSPLRARLRDALARSVVRANTHGDQPGTSQGDATGTHEFRYDVDDEAKSLAAGEQAAWIADALGGCWQREGNGACLVVDRVYPPDRAHGDAEVGHYAEALARCQHSLLAFDATRLTPADTPSLFAAARPVTTGGPPTADRPTSDSGLRTSDSIAQFLFFDLETTGLSGGAGTCAFLIGFGWFAGQSFCTRQYFLGGYGHERAMLSMAAQPLGPGVVLGTFNGRTFDVPLIEGRYLFHRLPSPFDAMPHVDLLHPARRLWRDRSPQAPERTLPREPAYAMDPDRQEAFARYFRSSAIRDGVVAGALTPPHDGAVRSRRFESLARSASCALCVLEDAILGFRRVGDVPGGEIPSRYFHYVRAGDVRPLVPVLEHNRFDLLSLAAVASVVARMLAEGPGATRTARECVALGRLYEHTGEVDRAPACYERAVEADEHDAGWPGDARVRVEALRRLALRHRRDERYEDAAATWRRLLELIEQDPSTRAEDPRSLRAGAGRNTALALEALHALAVHHEHRSRDLVTARAMVLRALGASHPTAQKSLRHRLARLERKLGIRTARTSESA